MKKSFQISSLSIYTVFILSAILLAFAAPARAGILQKNTSVMGTALEITVDVENASSAEAAFISVENEMKRIEDEMSEWKEGTYVSDINKNAGIKPVKVPDELFHVVSASVLISELSGGAFDITWASMRGVWDFRPGHEKVPSPEEIKKRLDLVNYKNIVLDEKQKTVFLRKKGTAIGLGAIAKGYAVDKAMRVLADEGIKNAIIKAGGDMRVQGLDNGKPWEIGIKNPRDREHLLAKLKLSNTSISTSGDYERYFIKDGVLYHHIMDPKTGYPAKKCRSVTILAPDTMTSDALSTAVFVMGPEKGMELVRKLKGVEAIIVDSVGGIHTSPGVNLQSKNP